MIRSLWISKTGLDAQQTQMDVTANNPANVSTNGFKRSRAVFEDLLYQTLRQPGAQSSPADAAPPGFSSNGCASRGKRAHLHAGQPPADGESARSRDPGQRVLPGADAGRQHGLHASRILQIDAQGQLVTSSGFPVQPAITIPANTLSITISRDGIVSAQRAGTTASPSSARCRSWAS